jgi:hypothetical protein
MSMKHFIYLMVMIFMIPTVLFGQWRTSSVLSEPTVTKHALQTINLDSNGAAHIVVGGDALYHLVGLNGGVLWKKESVDNGHSYRMLGTVIDTLDQLHVMYERENRGLFYRKYTSANGWGSEEEIVSQSTAAIDSASIGVTGTPDHIYSQPVPVICYSEANTHVLRIAGKSYFHDESEAVITGWYDHVIDNNATNCQIKVDTVSRSCPGTNVIVAQYYDRSAKRFKIATNTMMMTGPGTCASYPDTNFYFSQHTVQTPGSNFAQIAVDSGDSDVMLFYFDDQDKLQIDTCSLNSSSQCTWAGEPSLDNPSEVTATSPHFRVVDHNDTMTLDFLYEDSGTLKLYSLKNKSLDLSKELIDIYSENEFQQFSLQRDTQDNIHMSVLDSNMNVRYLKLDTQSEQIIGDSIALKNGVYHSLDMAMSNNGVLHFGLSRNSHPAYVSFSPEFNLTQLDDDFLSDFVNAIAIAIYNNTPSLAMGTTQSAYANDNNLTYLYKNNSAWTGPPYLVTQDNVGENLDMAIDSQGVVRIAYTNDTTGSLRYYSGIGSGIDDLVYFEAIITLIQITDRNIIF